MAAYPDDFSREDLSIHIDDLLARFRNRNLGDTVYRVGSDLQRKLGADDRFMAAIRMAEIHQLPYGIILKAMAMGFHFKAADEEGKLFHSDEAFHSLYRKDPELLLEKVCGLDPSQDVPIINELKQQLSAIL